jgi:hypothetical protein
VPDRNHRSTESGFDLDRDCPGADGCHGQNVENVFYSGPQPPPGHYVVEISLVDLRGAESPVSVRFGARLLSKTVGFEVNLSPGADATKTFAFDVS